MLYSCTYMATVGVKGSSDLVKGSQNQFGKRLYMNWLWKHKRNQLSAADSRRLQRDDGCCWLSEYFVDQSHVARCSPIVGQHNSFVLYALQWWWVCPGPTFSKLLWKILRRFLTLGQSLTISEKTEKTLTRHNLFNNNIITSNMTQNKNVNYNYYCFIIS